MDNKKIFSLNRIKYKELWDDALNYIKQTYKDNSAVFTNSSPFSQLLSVILHLGRLILFYIEDSISGQNLSTAYRPDQIRGLAQLTGHDAGRSIGARGSVRLTYNNTSDYEGQIIYIPNKLSISNKINGYNYILCFSSEAGKLTLSNSNFIDCNIVQGSIKMQQATGAGVPLQSFNFTERRYQNIDQYFINVYVDGEFWPSKLSLLDMGFDEKCCMVKTGISGGIDVFFGNGYNGRIPKNGSTIMVEYLVTDGFNGNIEQTYMTSGSFWEFQGTGYNTLSEEVDLNACLSISLLSDIILGSDPEDIRLTREIAPHTSRSMVLANKINYEYFLKKMNMFSIIDVIKGFETYEDSKAQANYNNASYQYENIKKNYIEAVSKYGTDSDTAVEIYKQLEEANDKLLNAEQVLYNSKLDDNVIYLFLIPDIRKRIVSSKNYFTCDESCFKLTVDEQANILNLIEQTGQRIMTIENRIISPLYPKFAVNVMVRIWEGYVFENIYSSIMEAVSEYLIDNTRRDRIPQSDLIRIIEQIDGVDSVTVYFEASKDNLEIYGNHYGIDEFGDIVLSRKVSDNFGNTVEVRDLYPLVRGGFSTKDGVTYSSEQSIDVLSALNVTLIGTSSKNGTNIENSGIVSK